VFISKWQLRLQAVILAVLTLGLSGFALYQLVHTVSQPYLLDIIGRSLRVASIELSNGRPIYSAPALAMSYTPGFLLLNAAVFKVFGFSYTLWNCVWAFGGISFLILFSKYFWCVKKAFAPFIPAALLSCLYPFLWARGDLYAIILSGTGIYLIEQSTDRYKELAAIFLFALTLLFKQTMLPVICAAILLSGNQDVFTNANFLRSMRLCGYLTVICILMLLSYITIWGERPSDVISVLTLGKYHRIQTQNLLFYTVMYLVMISPPCLYFLKNERWALKMALVLSLAGVPYIFFCAKDGGHWHHYLVLVLLWMWLIVKIGIDKRANVTPLWGGLYGV
jgi:hypothetical protein